MQVLLIARVPALSPPLRVPEVPRSPAPGLKEGAILVVREPVTAPAGFAPGEPAAGDANSAIRLIRPPSGVSAADSGYHSPVLERRPSNCGRQEAGEDEEVQGQDEGRERWGDTCS